VGRLGTTQGSAREAAREEGVADTALIPHREDPQNQAQGHEKREDTAKRKPGTRAEALLGINRDQGEDLHPRRMTKEKDTKTEVEV